jgi:hypothetical protein
MTKIEISTDLIPRKISKNPELFQTKIEDSEVIPMQNGTGINYEVDEVEFSH